MEQRTNRRLWWGPVFVVSAMLSHAGCGSDPEPRQVVDAGGMDAGAMDAAVTDAQPDATDDNDASNGVDAEVDATTPRC